jgi:hypothetical protein
MTGSPGRWLFGVARTLGAFLGAAFVASTPLCACSAQELGATASQLASAQARASLGANRFAGECARCHGASGAGLAGAPAILGPGALPEYPREAAPSGIPGFKDPEQMQIDSLTRHLGVPLRERFRTAEDLLSFLASHRRAERGVDANGDDGRAIVSFMVAAQGGPLPPEGVTGDNADALAIPHRK